MILATKDGIKSVLLDATFDKNGMDSSWFSHLNANLKICSQDISDNIKIEYVKNKLNIYNRNKSNKKEKISVIEIS